MDFTTNETHEEIRKAIRDLCRRFPDEYWAEHDDSHEFPWEFYNAVAEGGWLGLTVPEEYGGGGLGVNFHGDTMRAETTISNKRESQSRTDSRIVWFGHQGLYQRGELLCLFEQVGLMAKLPTDEEGER